MHPITDKIKYVLQNIKCWTCVKLKSAISHFFKSILGWGRTVLSPQLIPVYTNNIVSHLPISQRWLMALYADDILITAPSVSALQCLMNFCELELNYLDMLINVKNSCCMRIGPPHNVQCSNTATISGQVIPWVDILRYLAILIMQST